MLNKFYLSLLLLPNILEYIIDFLFNLSTQHSLLLLFISIGIYVINFLVISYFLHRWFVKGEGKVREKTKDKIKEIRHKWQEIQNYLLPGNELVLVKFYFIAISSNLIYRLLPGLIFTFLITLLIDFYKELTTFLQTDIIQRIYEQLKTYVIGLSRKVPHYSE